MIEYNSFFQTCTGKPSFPYQERFATHEELPSLLNVITGAGKTATVIIGWLWRLLYHPNPEVRKRTPRRLVYCLPMRTLVEQTFENTKLFLENAQLEDKVELHLLMGGAVSKRWDINPSNNCILIGTQDQLLSRALFRGYGMSRYRWPVHFALLNNDCLWVMDEVQLMGAGLRTSAQLQGFRDKFNTYGTCRSLWMSATLNPELLKTVDHPLTLTQSQILSFTSEDKAHPVLKQRLQAKKKLLKANTLVKGNEKEDAESLAVEVLQNHIPGTSTIVICNRVNRAQAVFEQISKHNQEGNLLIHARFRPSERQKLNEMLRGFKGILVATQALEAGVDISATTMFVELALWWSLVQRFGRCNRYGECVDGANIYWIDIDLNKKQAASPYHSEDLEEARTILSGLEDVSPATLETVDVKPQHLKGLIPRQSDLLQLFDTSSDLAGHDIDISSFIRESDDTDVLIAWRRWEGDSPNGEFTRALQQNELCRVSLWQAQKFIDTLVSKHKAWIWDAVERKWVLVNKLIPGMTILVHSNDGGYSNQLGFTANHNHKPEDVEIEDIELEDDGADLLTYGVGKYITLKQHSIDVAFEVEKLCSSLKEYNLPVKTLIRSGRWHDAGKAHAVFHKMLTHNNPDKAVGGPWAKSDGSNRVRSERPGFRHELVSALIALNQNEPFLLVYLVGAHHGRIRMSIQPSPIERKPPQHVTRFAMGVWEGEDCLLSVDLGDEVTAPVQLSLEVMELGETSDGKESWTERAIRLLEEYGPFKLAFLETIIRVADWRASASYQSEIFRRLDA